MTRVIAIRLLWAIPTLLGILTAIFLVMNVLPGDIALVIAGGGEQSAANPQVLARVRQELGLDRPLYVQYLSWMWGLVRLDLGVSLWTHQPVIQAIVVRLPYTVGLLLLASFISAILTTVVGIISAVKRDTWIDYGLRVFTIMGIALPNFWLAILVILLLIAAFHWFPPLDYATWYKEPGIAFQQLALPALVLGYRQTAVAARMLRSCMLEVLGEDYIRTARAKGLKERTVLLVHALKNAALPVITVFGLQLITLFGGVVIIEQIFTIPGIGRLLLDGMMRRDIPLVQGTVAFIAAFVLFTNILVDVLYGWLDPRIRYR